MANSGIYEEDYGQDPDHDSLYIDADSPTDGYFTQRPFPQLQFVENSTVAAEADAKAREATEERASSSETRPSYQHDSPTSPTQSPAWINADEQTPLLDAGPAPPDYAAATADRPAASAASTATRDNASDRPQSYGSTSERQHPRTGEDYHWPVGNRGNLFNSNDFPFGRDGNPFTNPNFPFGPNGNPIGNIVPAFQTGPPQSMSNRQLQYVTSDDPDEDIGSTRRYRNRRQKQGWRRLRRCCSPCYMLSWLLVLAVVAFLVVVSNFISANETPSHKTPKTGTPSHGGKNPSNPPVDHELPPYVPEDPPEPIIPAFPANRSLFHCPFVAYTDTHEVEFSSENFHFKELMEAPTALKIGISGTVWIQPAPKEQSADIKVSISYATTQLWRVTSMRYVQQDDTLQLEFPGLERQADVGSGEHSCLDVSIAIQVKQGLRLRDTLSLMTANLDIKAEGGLFDSGELHQASIVDIASTSSITAIRGKVDLAYWSSRETVVDVISGSIQGNFALRDLLILKSQSGSVSASVDPKEADPTRPVPAEFSASSISGSVNIAFPMAGDIPNRDYRTHVECRSGHLSGDYYLGSTTSLSTVSSSITANILPYDWKARAATLRTESQSGSTNIRVLAPHLNPDGPMGHLHSSHKTGSSSLKLSYPSQWEGSIDGESMSGSITLRGRGLVVDVDDHYSPVVKHVIAHKGHSVSTMEFRSISGSVSLAIGED